MIRSFLFMRAHGVRTLRLALVMTALGAVGCTQMTALKSKVGDTLGGSGTTSTNSTSEAAEPLPLNTIVSTYLMKGRYDEGEQRLRQYLAKYPNDHAAQVALRQLTTDPKVALGTRSRAYVAQTGDSYSTLAARHLGDSSLFLILARYNGSTNPSSLHVGDAVRLPLAGVRPNLSADTTTKPVARNTTSKAATTASAAAPAAAAPENPPSTDSPAARAQRLQTESSALLKQGQKDQALARLDQALTLDPQLKPAGNQALRDQLLASYHERAVVLYRDQKLDQAIALWDHVLAIDPGYERATVYRARAIELQQRLKQI
ncbi:LysM domain-containing protein [Dyella amyloliquefaciens]|uniref:LysM domain-containing protein n=1 Tax=Dyella amyloliquefaciens TaxID=1770545 RepID=UPI001E4CA9A3|nr:LysM domain-containing protein [Dyella amyloliquefaciens]